MVALKKLTRLAAPAAVAALIALSPPPASGQESGGEPDVNNVRFTSSRGEVRIRYDLDGRPGVSYSVTLSLRRAGDPSFAYVPSGVSGDIGDDVSTGDGKTIRWDIADEFPGGLPGDDYFFIVRAEPQEGGVPVVALAGIGLAAAGGVALYFLLINGDQPLSSASGYPGPPGRP